MRKIILLLPVALWLAPAASEAQTVITGSGGSFPAPVYSVWLDPYKKAEFPIQADFVGQIDFARYSLGERTSINMDLLAWFEKRGVELEQQMRNAGYEPK